MRSILRGTSLFFKVIVATSLILIVAISFNVWWNTTLHEASIEKLTHEKTKIISEFIEQNVVRQSSGRNNPNNVAFDKSFGGLWVFDLLADGNLETCLQHLL